MTWLIPHAEARLPSDYRHTESYECPQLYVRTQCKSSHLNWVGNRVYEGNWSWTRSGLINQGIPTTTNTLNCMHLPRANQSIWIRWETGCMKVTDPIQDRGLETGHTEPPNALNCMHLPRVNRRIWIEWETGYMKVTNPG